MFARTILFATIGLEKAYIEVTFSFRIPSMNPYYVFRISKDFWGACGFLFWETLSPRTLSPKSLKLRLLCLARQLNTRQRMAGLAMGVRREYGNLIYRDCFPCYQPVGKLGVYVRASHLRKRHPKLYPLLRRWSEDQDVSCCRASKKSVC